MHAYKQRPDESYIPVQRKSAVAVSVDGRAEQFVAHASPARAMHDSLLERLTATDRAVAVGLSMRARLGIMLLLAGAAWLPIVGVALLVFG